MQQMPVVQMIWIPHGCFPCALQPVTDTEPKRENAKELPLPPKKLSVIFLDSVWLFLHDLEFFFLSPSLASDSQQSPCARLPRAWITTLLDPISSGYHFNSIKFVVCDVCAILGMTGNKKKKLNKVIPYSSFLCNHHSRKVCPLIVLRS